MSTARYAGKPVYLDYNATTPIDPDVLSAMLPYFKERFGNPSSTHFYGQTAKEAVIKAREQVSKLIGADVDEVVFTSGGSESINHAIIGAAFANTKKGRHIVTSRIEHPAVLESCQYLEKRFGFKVSYLTVDKYGLISPEALERTVTHETTLITIMHANNEVGTIEPVETVGEIAKKKGVIFHVDAAQSCGKIEVDVNELNADLLTVAGHKLYAPKGVGALYIREGTEIDRFIHGAGQEKGRRAGTENVPYMVGLGAACDVARRSLSDYKQKTSVLRDRLHSTLIQGLSEDLVKLNGHPERRLPNTLNVSIKGVVGEELLGQIPGIAASTGSACHSGSTEPSRVLLEMGLSRKLALGALRLSLGRWTTRDEVDVASGLIISKVKESTAVKQ